MAFHPDSKAQIIEVRFTVNGKQHLLSVGFADRLLDILRNQLHLTGSKEGCGVGECGACTVLIDGKAECACLVLATQVDGSEIITVEGLAKNSELHPLQRSFIEHGAIQCGYCTPGMLMSAVALLHENRNPTEREIREAIAGNLCRCTGYVQIIQAVKDVVDSEALEDWMRMGEP